MAGSTTIVETGAAAAAAAAKEDGEGKAEPTVAMITKEMVPDSFIDRLKERPVFRRLPPINDTSGVYSKFPKMRDLTHCYKNKFAQRCDNALRGGLLFLPTTVNPTIYRGGYFLFTETGNFCPPR